MAIKKYLSHDGLTAYDTLIKEEIDKSDKNTLSSAKTYTDEAMSDVVTISGGASAATLADIFGEPPYTIEFTEELDEISNIVVAAGSDYGTYRLRNVAIVTEVPTQMNDGDIALVIKSGG